VAIKNQSIIVTYTAWDTANQAPKTGDVANHTLRVITDGTPASPSNSPSEVDATNAPGEYKITLTAGEMDGDFVTLAGKSSTADVVILPVKIGTERGRVDQSLSTTESNIRGGDSDDLKDISDEVATRAAPSDVTTAHAITNALEPLGTPMRGTDGANTTVPDPAGTAAALHAITNALPPLGTAMRGTDGANITVPDGAGTAAGLHAATDVNVDAKHVATDGLVNGLNDPTVGAIADGVFEEAMAGHDSAGTFGEFQRDMRAYARGNVAVSGDTFAYKDTDGSTVRWTATVIAASRTNA